jgi:hypothetical protein
MYEYLYTSAANPVIPIPQNKPHAHGPHGLAIRDDWLVRHKGLGTKAIQRIYVCVCVQDV